jgi:hypothetical protein
MLNEILEKLGLKYEELNSAERDTLNSWMEGLSKNQLSVEKIREYVSSMRDSVEVELADTKNGSKQDLLLKARLKNYMLLEAFLLTPEKAKAALERSMAGLASPVK